VNIFYGSAAVAFGAVASESSVDVSSRLPLLPDSTISVNHVLQIDATRNTFF